MAENENTKSGLEQNQPDAGAGPAIMQQESPRKCKICGGPNHHGCGCEARQKKAAVQVETENIKTPKQPKPEDYAVTQETKEDDLEDILSPDAIREAHEAQQRSHKDIATMAERSEKLFGHIEAMSDNLSDLCGVLQECRELLKLINDNILAQKIVEVKNVTG